MSELFFSNAIAFTMTIMSEQMRHFRCPDAQSLGALADLI